MITGRRASDWRRRRSVSSPLMPPMRTSMITRSGLTLGISFSPSSPLAAVVNSISAESKMRRNEYCTSASSSIKRSLSIGPAQITGAKPMRQLKTPSTQGRALRPRLSHRFQFCGRLFPGVPKIGDRAEQALQCPIIGRLYHVSVGPQFVGVIHVLREGGRGKDNDGRELPRIILPHPCDHVEPVQSRHLQIEQYQLWQREGGSVAV